jgi:D-alanyl-D-alanine carboxypeptidase
MNPGFAAGGRGRAPLALLTCAFLVLTLALQSCGSKSFDSRVQAELEEVPALTVSEYGAPGAMAGVETPEEGTWLGAEGVADVAGGRKIAPSDRFRIGSNTKSFVATVALQLVDEGGLGLEDTVDRLLPGIPGCGEVTVRQLLNMTSGIFNYTDDEGFWAEVEADPLKVWEPRRLVEVALSHPPYFEPGEEWAYSNTNYILLGMVIEEVTGSDVESEIQRRVIDRLKLEDTSFPGGPKIPGTFAHGYREGAGGAPQDVTEMDPSSAWTAGAMISSIGDMMTFVEALAEGTLLSGESHEEQLEFEDTGMPFVEYGLGVFGIRGYVGNGGAISGYSTAMFHSPSSGNTIVTMANRHPFEGGEPVAMQYMFPELMSALEAR